MKLTHWIAAALVISAAMVNAADAADLDICRALPVAAVNNILHRNLVGTRSDTSDEAHSYGCAYGSGIPVSVSVIRPGGSAALVRTLARLPKAIALSGLGDKAFYDESIGLIALFGDTAIAAFAPAGQLSDAQRSSLEKELIVTIQGRL